MFFLIGFLLITSCNVEERHYDYDSPVYQELSDGSQAQKEAKYQKLKSRIRHKRQLYYEEYHRSGDQHRKDLVALSKKYVYKTMVDTIFPFWYDTKWDYNGVTQTPGKGAIACGYFVTTCLRDMGFEVERATLAQQASSKIIQTVCGKGRTHVIGHNDTKQLKSYLLSQPDGIYIIGLDNHVGFIHKKGQEVKAVHSNGVSGSMKVVCEPIEDCKLINKSDAFYIGDFMGNTAAFNQWVKKQKIATVK